jgi:hypothetical protein
MADHDQHEPKRTISPEDIQARDVPRRGFFKGLGTMAGAFVVAGSLAGCETSDSCDSDTGDPVRADADPTDPVRSDSDTGDSCDSD